MKRPAQITIEQAYKFLFNAPKETTITAKDFMIGYNTCCEVQEEVEPFAEGDEKVTGDDITRTQTIYSSFK